jgi:hypothetical protein
LKHSAHSPSLHIILDVWQLYDNQAPTHLECLELSIPDINALEPIQTLATEPVLPGETELNNVNNNVNDDDVAMVPNEGDLWIPLSALSITDNNE